MNRFVVDKQKLFYREPDLELVQRGFGTNKDRTKLSSNVPPTLKNWSPEPWSNKLIGIYHKQTNLVKSRKVHSSQKLKMKLLFYEIE